MNSTVPNLQFSAPSKKSATPKTTTTPKDQKLVVPEEWKKPRNRIKLLFNSREGFKYLLEDGEFLKLLETDSFVEILDSEYVIHLHLLQKNRVETIHTRFAKKMNDLNVEFDAAVDTIPSWDTFKEDNELTQKLLLLKKEVDNVKELKEVESLEPVVKGLTEIKELKEAKELEEVKNVEVQDARKRKSDRMTNPEEGLSSTGHKELKMSQASSFKESSTGHKQLKVSQDSSYKESTAGKEIHCHNCMELKQENVELHKKVDMLMNLLKALKQKKQKRRSASMGPATSSSQRSPKESDAEFKESDSPKSALINRKVFLEDLFE